jgi:hypothetical protein
VALRTAANDNDGALCTLRRFEVLVVFGSGMIVVNQSLVGLCAQFHASWCGSYGGLVASAGSQNLGWVERVLLLANDINETSRVLISDRFYTRTIAFQMLQQQKCRSFG